jgi:quercetin 2,3-dioxygenase
MITVRKAQDRGHAEHGWLNTHHTFSFNTYYDPQHMGFRSLRVINEDVITGKQGFGMHPHNDMEIITYVVSGELTHKDDQGNEGKISEGNIQVMSAGTGVAHSEFNETLEPVHLLQVWIMSKERGLEPKYIDRKIEKRDNELILIADNKDIYQDAKIYVSRLNKETTYDIRQGRGVWIQLIEGKLEVNGTVLEKGDGAAIEDEKDIKLKGTKAHFMMFDLA